MRRAFFHWLFTAPHSADAPMYGVLAIMVLFGLPFHAAFIAGFALLGVVPMALWNVLSVSLWAAGLWLGRRGLAIAGAGVVFCEALSHAALSVHFLGWQAGFQQFCITLATGAVVLPVRRALAVLFSVMALVAYIALYFYDAMRAMSGFELAAPVANTLYVFNTLAAILVVTATVLYHMRQLEQTKAALQAEHAKSEALLHNTLPSPIAERLKQDGMTIADGYPSASVLFADIANFTPLSQAMTPKQVVELLDHLFSCFDDLVARHGLEKIKTVGDAYMVAAGIPLPRPDHADAIARFALDLEREVAEYNREHDMRLRLRIGINSGPVVAGVIGRLRFLYDLWGDAVNTASRMESHGVPGTIQVSEETRRLLSDQFVLEERGVIDVKGKGLMRTYFLRRGAQIGEGV